MLLKRVDIDSDNWIYLKESSKQYSPFIEKSHLEALGASSHNYVIEDGNKVLGGIFLPVDINTGEIVSLPYSMYQGILLNESEDSSKYKQYVENLSVTSFVAKAITEIYKNIRFYNHWSIIDIRGLDWHNYHESEKGRFNFNIQYTAIKKLEKNIELIKYIGKRRHRDYKKFEKNYIDKIEIESSKDIDEFIELYKKTFERQNIIVDIITLEKVKKIALNAIEGDYGDLKYLKINGESISAIVTLFDKTTEYYMFGATEPDLRDSGAGTYLMVEAILSATHRDKKYFVFLGDNCPERGDYKLSFGSELKPYYVVSFNKNEV